LDGGDNFRAAHMTPATGNFRFEQADDFPGWQMRVQLAGYSEKPRVNAFPGSGRAGNQTVQPVGYSVGGGG
jgi:hypothetical protein